MGNKGREKPVLCPESPRNAGTRTTPTWIPDLRTLSSLSLSRIWVNGRPKALLARTEVVCAEKCPFNLFFCLFACGEHLEGAQLVVSHQGISRSASSWSMEVRHTALDQNETVNISLEAEVPKEDGGCLCCFWRGRSLFLIKIFAVYWRTSPGHPNSVPCGKHR